MALHLHGDVVIARPVEEVFDRVAEERNPYDPRVRRAEKLTPGAVRPGTRFRSEAKGVVRPVVMTVELVEYDRPHRLVSATRLSGMDIESTMLFDAVPDGTPMRWSSVVHPRGPLKLLTPLLRRRGQRQTEEVWRSLRQALETPPRRL